MAPRLGWLGFDDRVFLTPEEHDTYLRRLPVRYSRKNLPTGKGRCSVCNEAAREDNALQAAHVVPFNTGTIHLWLTPDWLDSEHNLVWAHAKDCNNRVEIHGQLLLNHLREKHGIKVPAAIIKMYQQHVASQVPSPLPPRRAATRRSAKGRG